MVEFIAVALLALVVALEENISNSSAVVQWSTLFWSDQIIVKDDPFSKQSKSFILTNCWLV